MNKVVLIGNLTRDPELKTTNSNIPVCNLGLAVNRPFGSGQGGEREVDFFNITVWREQGENCYKYLKKGNKVAVLGYIQIRSYEDKDGVKRNVTDIVAENVEFLTPRSSDQNAPGELVPPPVRKSVKDNEPIEDEHLPF
ncbi:MAG: single-stranded DNA-binding protein [Firmicutes bacterium]|nr:single-stranded DNA-binding protein [Bacillota bacterium]